MAFQMRITEFSQPVQQVLIDVFGFERLDLVANYNLTHRKASKEKTSPEKLSYWVEIDECQVCLYDMSEEVTNGTFQANIKKKIDDALAEAKGDVVYTGEFSVDYKFGDEWGVAVLTQKIFLQRIETDAEYAIQQNRLKHEIYLDKAIQEMKESEASLKK